MERSARHRAWNRIRIAGRAIEQGGDPEVVSAHASELVEAVKELEEWSHGALAVGSLTLSHGQMALVYSMARIGYASKTGTEEGRPGWVAMRDARERYRQATADELMEMLPMLDEAWTRLGVE